MKICVKCDTGFTPSGNNQKYCSIDCRDNAYFTEGNIKKYSDRYSEKYPERRLVISAKARAKKKGLPFNLKYEDVVVPEKCEVLGISLERGRGHGPNDASPSLDRIVPELGYTKGNVRVISNLANRMLSNADDKMLLRFACWIRNNIGEF